MLALREATRSARLESRTTPENKALVDQAAALQGVTVSEFVVTHVVMAARDTINRLENTVLRPKDRAAFMGAFEDTTPNKKLVDLMALHRRVNAEK